MEQSLEQSVQMLVKHLEITEKRYQQEKRRSRWLGIALILSLVICLTTVIFNIHMVNEVQAVDTEFPQQTQSSQPNLPMQGMEELVKEATLFLKALNAPETQQAMGNLVTFINSDDTQQAMKNVVTSINSDEVQQAMNNIVTFINSKQISKAFAAMANLASHIELDKLAKAMELIDDIILKAKDVLENGEIASGISDLFDIIQGISTDMRVMAVDMHRMSSTATPAMGEMYDIMRFVPVPR